MVNNQDLIQIRRSNLKRFLAEKNMSQTDLAKKLSVQRAYISSLLRTRTFGEKAARSIEQTLGMPTGYLDLSGEKPKVIDKWDKTTELPNDVYALVPRLAVNLSAGGGCVPSDEDDLPPLAFRKDWLQKRLVTSRKNLRVVSVHGDSMANYLFDGDIVMIDTGQNIIKDNNVYAILHSGELRIKRLIKTFEGGVRIRSDNASYPEEILTPAQAETLTVLGAAIWRAG